MSDADLSPRKAPSQQRSARTVDRIVDAAVRVFDDVGYGAATTNESALEARVSIGSVYQYFPTTHVAGVIATTLLDLADPATFASAARWEWLGRLSSAVL